jgi:hypothetical protein
MLHSVDENDLIVFEDLIDDAVCGPETLERTDKRLAEPLRVLALNRCDSGLGKCRGRRGRWRSAEGTPRCAQLWLRRD